MTKKSPNRVIKRYPNRKLYDTEQSRYIKLKEVARLVREGVEVQIVDNQSGEDITGPTLAKLLGTVTTWGRGRFGENRHLVQSDELLNRKVAQPVTTLRERRSGQWHPFGRMSNWIRQIGESGTGCG